MAQRIWQKSTKLWQPVQHLKCKVSGKILVQILVNYKMNATSFCTKYKSTMLVKLTEGKKLAYFGALQSKLERLLTKKVKFY
jgi:hypothetical protein